LRSSLTLVVAIAALIAVAGACSSIRSRPAARPNVLIVTIDTLRADHIGSYGMRTAQTPVIDAIARRGTRFTTAIAHVPLTLPSHASLFTSLTPPRHGVRNNPEFVLPDAVPTLAERFKAAGYDTAAFVSGFPLHRRFGLGRGFDVYDDRFPRGDGAAPYTERRAGATAAAVRDWFSRRGGAGDAKPFFAWVHFFDPHRPYDAPEPFRSRFSGRPYDGEIAYVDAELGEVLKSTGDESGNRTILVVTADHGEGLDEHGEPTHGLLIYDSTIRVPLVFAGPGIARARIVDSPVALVDVAPTLLDIVGLPALPSVDGRSLRGSVELRRGGPPSPSGETAAHPPAAREERGDPIYVESMFGRLCCGWAPLHGIRDGVWMYIDAPEPELYDVASDPTERENVAAAHPEKLAAFQRAVRAAARAAGPAPAAAARTSESAERMASLGYLAGSSDVKPSLRDPKQMVALAERMENAIAREHVDPPAAARELGAVVAADPSNALARRHLAIALSAAREFFAAIRETEELRRMGDTSVETAILAGECQRLAGRAGDAVGTLKAAADRDPRNPDALDALGRALVAAGDRDAARDMFARALALQPDDAEAGLGLADLAIERGDFREARERLQSLRARDPDDPSIGVKLGTVLARSGELQPAILLFKELVDRFPGNVDACVNLAAALAKAGDTPNAVAYFERAVAAGAASPAVFNGLAVARLQLGDRMRAAEAMRRSLALRPDQADIRMLLQQIETGR
jgi:arylsulfatase A-like enzyme/thioredoxin-like negative regulator of GroEL